MTPGARIAAAIGVLDAIGAGAGAEKALTGWARASRYAGSGDRAAVRDHVFDALRCRRSFAAHGGGATGRGLMIGMLRAQGLDPAMLFTGDGHAPDPLTPAEQDHQTPPMTDAARLDCPDWLWPLFQDALGGGADAALQAMQSRAPVFLRVNLRRGTRAGAQAALAADKIATQPVADVRTALEVTENARKVMLSQAYRTGLIEVQDAASQLALLRLPLADGMRVLDYCAGGGGKALGMADLAAVTVTAHDIDPGRMVDLPVRAARAGVRIDICGTADLPQAAYDLVLCDAPCSGSGTWRRTPEAKWHLTPARLAELCALQAEVLANGAAVVAPGGVLAYATCSVLDVENAAQIDAFLARNPGWQATEALRTAPGPAGDGFYLSVIRKPA